MEFSAIKNKICHFLLKKCESYRRALKNGTRMPPVSTMAKEIQKVCPIGERRIQKYLYENTSEKELSITLSDLIEFSNLAGSSLGEFVAYLTRVQSDIKSLDENQRNLLLLNSRLDLALKREINMVLLDPKMHEKGEYLLKTALLMSKLKEPEQEFVLKIIKNLK